MTWPMTMMVVGHAGTDAAGPGARLGPLAIRQRGLLTLLQQIPKRGLAKPQFQPLAAFAKPGQITGFHAALHARLRLPPSQAIAGAQREGLGVAGVDFFNLFLGLAEVSAPLGAGGADIVQAADHLD